MPYSAAMATLFTPILTLTLTLIVYLLLRQLLTSIYNLYFHPLLPFPGPTVAAASDWYKTYHEVFLQKSWVELLSELHEQYGPIVRVGPNELHFARPSAYNDIYSSSNRWDKERALYESFGEDRSSFGFLTYAEAKERKDILTPLFSRRAILNLQGLVQSNVDRLCEILQRNNATGASSDLFFGLRCFTMDTITSFCFAKSVDALGEPDFKAPIIEAMEASLPAFILFKHFSPIRKAVFNMPPWLSTRLSPQTAGLVQLQQILGRQVNEVVRNPESLNDAPHPIIYHKLLDKDANKSGVVPAAGSLYEEAQALMFGGADTNGNTLMMGTFYILENLSLLKRLKDELNTAWPNLALAPRFEELEKLPFLTAIVKESLRVTPGVPSPLLRVVPHPGAKIDGVQVPANAIVGMSSVFIHNSEELFKDALEFKPDRWLQEDSKEIEKWLVAFSKGPRACLGQNLAYCELYLIFAALFRRFDLELDGTRVEDLTWRDCFLPHFQGRHLQVFCKPVDK